MTPAGLRARFILHTTRSLLVLLCTLLAAPAAATPYPIAQRLQVATTCPSRGRPERSEDGGLGGAGRAQAAGRARNGVGTPNDAMGNLSGAAYVDGRVDLRMPDAVGNLFRTADRSDRKYGAAGQLLESRDARGVTSYGYDAEGNLTKKVEPDGAVWTYEWNGAGMLTRVVRPNGHAVEFRYDPLARRTAKKYRGKTTRWIWDGNVPLHEWVERDPDAVDEDFSRAPREDDAVAAAEKQLKAMLSGRPAQGPPIDAATAASLKAASREGTVDTPVTWVFEPESFAPLAKIVGGERFGIVTDHLGTPRGMFDAQGREVWAADIDAYGDLRTLRGERQACPFRWPGQYEDGETGLYYNRWRYYDSVAGQFASVDPIRLAGTTLALYSYTFDPTTWVDPFGLNPSCRVSRTKVPNASDLPMIERGSKEWDEAVEALKKEGRGDVRVRTPEDAKDLLKEARGNMDRHKNYTDAAYDKGFEMHNHKNPRESDVGNDLRHVKWTDWGAIAQGRATYFTVVNGKILVSTSRRAPRGRRATLAPRTLHSSIRARRRPPSAVLVFVSFHIHPEKCTGDCIG